MPGNSQGIILIDELIYQLTYVFGFPSLFLLLIIGSQFVEPLSNNSKTLIWTRYRCGLLFVKLNILDTQRYAKTFCGLGPGQGVSLFPSPYATPGFS
jgi:hypothetical protein